MDLKSPITLLILLAVVTIGCLLADFLIKREILPNGEEKKSVVGTV